MTLVCVPGVSNKNTCLVRISPLFSPERALRLGTKLSAAGVRLTCTCYLQDLYQQPIQKLVDFVITAYNEHPNLNLEVFVHKADVLTEEYKIGETETELDWSTVLKICRELPSYTGSGTL